MLTVCCDARVLVPQAIHDIVGGFAVHRAFIDLLGSRASRVLKPADLFVPQGFDRIHVGGAMGGIDTENDPDAE